MNRPALTLAVSLLTACSTQTPTAPTPLAVVPPVVLPPPVVTPPPMVTPPTPTRNPLLDDPRFDPAFYRMFVHNALEADPPNQLQPLRRQSEAPRIYMRTVDDAGRAIDSITLDLTAQALINTTGLLTGVFGLAGLERGVETRQGQRGWITVRWSDRADGRACGTAQVGGDLITLYPRNNCRCPGFPAIMEMATIKHELGHTLGYWHTDNIYDLMYGGNFGECDKNPSAREIFHARVAYSMPIGSFDP